MVHGDSEIKVIKMRKRNLYINHDHKERGKKESHLVSLVAKRFPAKYTNLCRPSLVSQTVKNLPAMQKNQV